MKKRILGILITLVMLIGLVIATSITANAEIYIDDRVNPYMLSVGDIISETYIEPGYGNSLKVYKATSVNDTTPDGDIIANLITSRDQKYLNEPYYVTYMSDTVLVLYPLKTCTITFNPNGGVGETKSINGYQEIPLSKQAVSFEAYTRAYYTFTGWNTAANGSGTTVTDDFVPSSNTVVYAQWTPNTYTVNFNANGGTINSGNVTSYTYGTGATLPTDVTKTGYTFSGWYASADFSGSAVTTVDTTETGDKTYYAKWTPNTYTVNLNANGGEVAPTSTSVIFDKTYGTLPTPTRTGYTFVGWYTDYVNGNKVESSTAVTITDTQTLYARWEKIVYNVTLGESLHGDVNIPTANATMDDTVSVIITPDAGYAVDAVTFNGVAATKFSENNYTFTMPAADAVVAVTYKKIPYTVTPLNDGTAAGGSFSVDMSTVTIGDTVTITVNPNLGYLIDSVTFNGAAATNNGDGTYSFTMPAQNVLVSVAFDVDLPAIAKELQLLNDADAALQSAISNGDNDLTAEISALSTAITNAQNAINDLDNGYATDAQLGELKSALEAAENTMTTAINALKDRVTEIENQLSGIDLSEIATNKQEIADLTTELGDLNTLVNTLQTNYITADTNLQAQITALDTKLTKLIDQTIAELTDSVNKLKDDLNTANGKINTNASDVATLKNDVSTLKTWKDNAQSAIEALQALTSTQGTNISALQTAVADLQNAVNTANDKITSAENRIATLEGKVTDLEMATANLRNAVTALQTAVATKADAATTTAAIQNLQAAVAALEAAKNNYIGADDALRTELEGKIETAKGEAISAAETLVNNAKAELQSKIDTKADAATTTVAIQKLQAAVAALEAVKDDYATADATLKTELEGKIEAAKDEAISAAEALVNNAKAELQSKIDAKADAATTTVAIENLQAAVAALEAVKDDYATADATLKTELEGKIETAKGEAITAANTALTTAKNELSQAIALKADTATLNAKVDALNTAITNAESVAKAYADTQDAALKAELQTAIANAKSDLEALIGGVQSDLDTTKAKLDKAIEDLNKAITDGDKNLSDEIAALNTALTKAKAALEKADADNKTALEAKIEAAESTLDAAIKAVQKNLDDAKAELNKAIADGDTALDDKISALNEALATVKTALEATDSANKSDLIAKIDEADATLKAAIDALSNELNATNEKVAELETFIIIVCVISGVALCGCGTLAVFYIIIDKEKKI